MSKKITGHKDIVEARRFIFEQMVNLSEGKITIQEGVVQAKLGHQLMEGYKTQVRFIEVANQLADAPIQIGEVTKMIEE